MNTAKQAVISALETCDVDHDQVPIKGALESASNVFLTSFLDYSSGDTKCFVD